MAILNKRRSTSQLPQLQQRSIYEPFVNLEAGERGREILRPNGVRDRGELSTGRPVTSVVQGEGSPFSNIGGGRQPSFGGTGRQPSAGGVGTGRQNPLGGVASRPITSTTTNALAPRTGLGGTRAGMTTKPIGTKPAATLAKPSVASKTAISKTPAASKTTATTAKPAIAAKPALTSKTTAITAKPAIAKTTATTPATKTSVTPTAKPTVTKSTGTTSKLGTALTGAALGAATKAVIDKITGSSKTPVSKLPSSPITSVVKPTGSNTNVGTPPFVPPKTTSTATRPTGIPTSAKPTNLPSMGGGQGVRPGSGTPSIKAKQPKVSGPTAKSAAQVKAENPTLSDEEVQAELDRARAEGAAGLPEGAEENEDGTYSVTSDGMTTTYAADGSIIGMEAAEDDTTGVDTTDTTDTSDMTDLGEGYFQDASGNIYGADGNLMYTLGENGEYLDANDTSSATEDVTTWTDPDTGLTWNMGADGEWTQEGFDSSADEDVTTYTDPDTGFTWNLGADGEWTQEGFDDTIGYDDTTYDDTLGDDTDYSLEDDTDYSLDDYEGDFKRGGLAAALMKRGGKARRFDDGGYTGAGYGEDDGYSDTGEEVQPFQNVGYNYGELGDPTLSGYTLTGNINPIGNTYLRSSLPSIYDEPEITPNANQVPGYPSGYLPSPDEWPDGYVDNGDGTATRVDDDGSTITIDADTNIIFTTDSEGNVFNPTSTDRTPSTGITSTGSTGGQRYRTDPAEQPTGGLSDNSSLFNTIKDSLGTYAGSAAAGALLASLLDSADNGGGGGGNTSGIDMSQVGVLNPRTTDFGIGPARYVGYDEYGSQDEMPEMYGNELYKNLNAPGFNPVNEGDYADPNEVQYGDGGDYSDESEYGDEAEAVDNPEEETAEMADGGVAHQTYYTFGKLVDPLVNLGLKGGQPMKSGGLSHGGLPAWSNVPLTEGRLNFKQGAAVHGAGDGQSDDIPAMLADGEYVIDAETVAQIGNGSTKAGAHALDKFRENIRAHKRSAPVNKIPPKTKALTSYLRGAK